MKMPFRFDRLRKMRPRTWLKLLLGTGFGGFLIVVFLLLWLPYIGIVIRNMNEPGRMRAYLKRFKEVEFRHYALPAGVWAIKPYSGDLKEKAGEFQKAWEEFGNETIVIKGHNLKINVRLNTAAGIDDYDLVQKQSLSFDQVTSAYEQLVTHREYLISAISADLIYAEDGDNRAFPYLDYRTSQHITKFLCARAESLASEGKVSEALRHLELAMRGSRTDPYDILISQLIAFADCAATVKSWQKIIKGCSDPQLLREALRLENSLAKYPADYKVQPWGELPLEVVDMIGIAREAMRRGAQVDTQATSYWGIQATGFRAMGIYERDVASKALSKNPALAKKASESGERMIKGSVFMEGKITPVKLSPRWLLHALRTRFGHGFCYMDIPNHTETKARLDCCKAKFDLLRLETARKLYEIEQGKPLARAADLAPNYLPSIPKDYATERKEEYRRGAAGFYSLGPDKMDQKGSLIYDPTNGALSAGDVCVDVK